MPSPYTDLPANVDFSPPRKAGEQEDELDIIVDGKIVHTMKFSTSQIKGSSSEEFVHARAHIEAKDWLRKNRYLPFGE